MVSKITAMHTDAWKPLVQVNSEKIKDKAIVENCGKVSFRILEGSLLLLLVGSAAGFLASRNIKALNTNRIAQSSIP